MLSALSIVELIYRSTAWSGRTASKAFEKSNAILVMYMYVLCMCGHKID